VSIRIYNETGRLVDSITEERGPGRHQTSVSVSRFAIGIYFYIFTAQADGSAPLAESPRKFVVLH
jgi:hypothetical protein